MEVATERTTPTNSAPAAAERKYTTISIPQPLYQEIKKAIEGTGFRSPTEYLVYVTRMALHAANPAPASQAPRAPIAPPPRLDRPF